MSALNTDARTTDRFGRSWFLPPAELCPECGQPDNCGDCSHERLSDDDVETLLGFPPCPSCGSTEADCTEDCEVRLGLERVSS